MNDLFNNKSKIIKISFYFIFLFLLLLLFPTVFSIDTNSHPILGHLLITFKHFIPIYSILGGFLIASLLFKIPLNIICIKKGLFKKDKNWSKIYFCVLVLTLILITFAVLIYIVDNSISPHPSYFISLLSIFLFLILELINDLKTIKFNFYSNTNTKIKFYLFLLFLFLSLVMLIISIILTITNVFTSKIIDSTITYNITLFSISFLCSLISATCLNLSIIFKKSINTALV